MSSPSSPLLSVEELPRWVKHRVRGASVFSNGRLRIALVAVACILMGYLLTASFGGSADTYSGRTAASYDHSDILEGPADYGGKLYTSGDMREEDRFGGSASGNAGHHMLGGAKNPSIKDALSDLHNAVSGTLSGLTSSLRKGMSGKNITRSGIFSDYESYNGSNPSFLGNTTVSEEILSPGRDMLGARQRVGKVTIIFGGAAIYERAVRTHEAHDSLHGYPLFVLRHGILDDVWSKPAYMLSLLLRELSKPEAERLQWLLWVDADTILLNPHIPVETFLPPSPEFDDVHILVTRDWNGLNNGVFPVRVSQWAVDLFAAIVSYRYYRPDAPLVFRDQSAMDSLLKEPRFARHVAWAPQRWFNAYQGEHNETLAPFQVRRGDFLVHFAGVGDRTERMTYWLDRVEQHLPDWEIEVQHTSYPTEARDFWSQQRGLRSDAARQMVAAKEAANELYQKTEDHMAEYQMRLAEGQIQTIREQQKKLKELVDSPEPELEAIGEASANLTSARTPLDAITHDADKTLLKAAHEAIFSAEKVLLAQTDHNNPSVTLLETQTAHLKKLVLQPSWLKADLTAAIDEVRRSRAGLERSQMAVVPLSHEEVAKVAALERVQKEADLAKAEMLGSGGVGPGMAPAAPAAVAVGVADPVVGPVIVDGVENVFVTHTATAVEMVTHMVVVQETMTVNPNPNR